MTSKSKREILRGTKISARVSGRRNPPVVSPTMAPPIRDIATDVTNKTFMPMPSAPKVPPTAPPTAPATTPLPPAAVVKAAEPCPTEVEADRAAKIIACCITDFLKNREKQKVELPLE
jgi:hypothetical protein